MKDEYAAFTENSERSLKEAVDESEGMQLRMQHMKREVRQISFTVLTSPELLLLQK